MPSCAGWNTLDGQRYCGLGVMHEQAPAEGWREATAAVAPETSAAQSSASGFSMSRMLLLAVVMSPLHAPYA